MHNYGVNNNRQEIYCNTALETTNLWSVGSNGNKALEDLDAT